MYVIVVGGGAQSANLSRDLLNRSHEVTLRGGNRVVPAS
jgi:hypothetical protein